MADDKPKLIEVALGLIFDAFAGGGAISLEARRLGLEFGGLVGFGD